MENLVEAITILHKRTRRDYVGRMMDDKVACMQIAKRYGREYWDGDRRYGYGGYHYDGRWQVVARRLTDLYKLPANAKILDVGCGKAYLLYELQQLLPEASVTGFDVSEYGLHHAKPEIRSQLFQHRAQAPYPYADDEFDLVFSITTLHNLELPDLSAALTEIERVGRNKIVAVESYRNEQELFNLQCWALTCAAFHTPREWQWVFDDAGYTGDYEFIYFE